MSNTVPSPSFLFHLRLERLQKAQTEMKWWQFRSRARLIHDFASKRMSDEASTFTEADRQMYKQRLQDAVEEFEKLWFTRGLRNQLQRCCNKL